MPITTLEAGYAENGNGNGNAITIYVTDMTNKATALEWRTLFNSNLLSIFFEL